MALNRNQIRALRSADSVSFYTDNESRTTITATIKATESDPFEKRLDIVVESRFESFAPGSEFASAYASLLCADTSAHWQSIASTIRDGDDVRLIWSADAATTQALRSAGFRGDVLRIEVARDGGEARFSFDLIVAVCEDNTARMVKIKRTSGSIAEAA